MQPTSPGTRSLSKTPKLTLPELLVPYPGVVARLVARGARFEAAPGDARFALENHLASQLMALFRDENDAEAFEALHAYTRSSVHDWILSLLRGSARTIDALEIMQDAYINVYKYSQSFRSDHDGSFRVWVRTIAGNLIRRAYSRRPTRRFEDMPEGLQEPADSRPGPRALVELEEDRARLRRAFSLYLLHYRAAFELLSERDRRAMTLVEVDGFTYNAAGERLGVRASNMKMILFRARKRLVNHMRRSMGVLPGLGMAAAG